MSERQVIIGTNRTGAQMSPEGTARQLEATRLFPPMSPAT